ncbi:MAG TPA: STAS domain-containing protein [Pseudonocardiaceae bacterium]|jgi:anti-sigma B factor antagonist|nr:STAS domain-containing protein [Pseudonocardiaceae bacterium]
MTARFHTTTSAGGAVTVTAIGEIDPATAGQFRDTLAHAGADRDRLTIDLTAVDYLDSAGIRVLDDFAASHALEILVQPGGVVIVTLQVSGLVDVVTLRHPSTEVAEQGGPPP